MPGAGFDPPAALGADEPVAVLADRERHGGVLPVRVGEVGGHDRDTGRGVVTVSDGPHVRRDMADPGVRRAFHDPASPVLDRLRPANVDSPMSSTPSSVNSSWTVSALPWSIRHETS